MKVAGSKSSSSRSNNNNNVNHLDWIWRACYDALLPSKHRATAAAAATASPKSRNKHAKTAAAAKLVQLVRRIPNKKELVLEITDGRFSIVSHWSEQAHAALHQQIEHQLQMVESALWQQPKVGIMLQEYHVALIAGPEVILNVTKGSLWNGASPLELPRHINTTSDQVFPVSYYIKVGQLLYHYKHYATLKDGQRQAQINQGLIQEDEEAAQEKDAMEVDNEKESEKPAAPNDGTSTNHAPERFGDPIALWKQGHRDQLLRLAGNNEQETPTFVPATPGTTRNGITFGDPFELFRDKPRWNRFWASLNENEKDVDENDDHDSLFDSSELQVALAEADAKAAQLAREGGTVVGVQDHANPAQRALRETYANAMAAPVEIQASTSMVPSTAAARKAVDDSMGKWNNPIIIDDDDEEFSDPLEGIPEEDDASVQAMDRPNSQFQTASHHGNDGKPQSHDGEEKDSVSHSQGSSDGKPCVSFDGKLPPADAGSEDKTTSLMKNDAGTPHDRNGISQEEPAGFDDDGHGEHNAHDTHTGEQNESIVEHAEKITTQDFASNEKEPASSQEPLSQDANMGKSADGAGEEFHTQDTSSEAKPISSGKGGDGKTNVQDKRKEDELSTFEGGGSPDEGIAKKSENVEDDKDEGDKPQSQEPSPSSHQGAAGSKKRPLGKSSEPSYVKKSRLSSAVQSWIQRASSSTSPLSRLENSKTAEEKPKGISSLFGFFTFGKRK